MASRVLFGRVGREKGNWILFSRGLRLESLYSFCLQIVCVQIHINNIHIKCYRHDHTMDCKKWETKSWFIIYEIMYIPAICSSVSMSAWNRSRNIVLFFCTAQPPVLDSDSVMSSIQCLLTYGHNAWVW